MATEWTLEYQGETHIFVSDLPDTDELSTMSCDDWVTSQPVEMQTTWSTFINTNEATDAVNEVYASWMTACKMTHTVKTGDTVRFTNSYK